MAKKRYQTRLPADQAERVDKYTEQRQITEAEGVRRLILAGLEAEGMEDPALAGLDFDEDEPDEADESDEADEDDEIATRTFRSSGIGTILQLVQVALLLAIFLLVGGI